MSGSSNGRIGIITKVALWAAGILITVVISLIGVIYWSMQDDVAATAQATTEMAERFNTLLTEDLVKIRMDVYTMQQHDSIIIVHLGEMKTAIKELKEKP